MRSKLFVPGSRPELFAKAMAGEADGLSFDLEDAVDESMKGKAREEVARFLRSSSAGHGKTIIVARERPGHAALPGGHPRDHRTGPGHREPAQAGFRG
jgi:citrate lyase subunit beta/citryl-CoA lyase